ncbi:MAG: T9SS type A sorting domain-containing protein [Bacteroidetes bacterium]|nr:MAG: T9SS type A sorting domain-containing protein [Bacteroidota bacterium]
MKKLLLIALALMGISAQAQYFQHEYGNGPAIGTVNVHGQNTRYAATGHLIGGHFIDISSTPLYLGSLGIFAAHADDDGRFVNTTDFNNHYVFNDGSGTYTLRITSAQVIEFEDGSGYGAVGAFHRWQNIFYPSAQIFGQGIAYIRLDASGNVISIQGYQLSSVIGTVPFVTGLRESEAGNGDLFATGTNGDDMWAMKIDQNGGLLWGSIYDVAATPNDIIESPYTSTVIIVGQHSNNAFWMEVNPGTGALNSFDVKSSGTGASLDRLFSIDISADPAMPGFVLGGEIDGRAWVVKTSQTGLTQWSGQYWSGTTPAKYLRGHDVAGRLKVFDDCATEFEYFVTGPFWSTTSDGNAIVFKIDRSGNPINPNGLFVYDYGYEETGNSVDVNTSGTGDGVTMYAIKEDDPLREAYVVKAYFNGVSGCNEYFEDLDMNWVQFSTISSIVFGQSSFGTTGIYIDHIGSNPDNELCHATVIGTGSNDYKAQKQPRKRGLKATPSTEKQDKMVQPNEILDKGAEPVIIPNPAEQNTKAVEVKIMTETSAKVDVTIYDMLGREYYNNSFALAKGNNRLTLDISATNMVAGMYTVKVRGEGVNKNITLMVK